MLFLFARFSFKVQFEKGRDLIQFRDKNPYWQAANYCRQPNIATPLFSRLMFHQIL